MSKLAAKQIGKFLGSFIGLAGIAVATANSVNITSALTTALNTASDYGTAVPLQAAVARTSMGVIVAGDNALPVFDNTSQQPISIGGQAVYARVTAASGVYTASFFVRTAAGAETAQAVNATVQIGIPYLFDFDSFPADSAIQWFDVSPGKSGSGGKQKVEQLTVTAANTVSNLAAIPADPSVVILNVNGADLYNPLNFSVAGQTITISAAQATATGYPIATTDTVFALYTA